MRHYFRPILSADISYPTEALALGSGRLWFTHVERISRNQVSKILSVEDLPIKWKRRLCRKRSPISGINFNDPKLMGILNVTPDSFSDGGNYGSLETAVAKAKSLCEDGADFIDIGGESTRPGSKEIPIEVELARIRPVIENLQDIKSPISVDTRKARVADVAISCGALLVNDVSGFRFDPALLPLCVDRAVSVCVMHSKGIPETMQNNPTYGNVLLDVYDYLEKQIYKLVDSGIPRTKIIADPGIGFGKTLDHNLALLRKISLFHGLGVPLLLGLSRKGFIGTVTGVENAKARVTGSVAAALTGVSQGVQLFRVHDVKETRQAFDMWQMAKFGDFDG